MIHLKQVRPLRENHSLKVQVCAILTFITLGILIMFLIVLPSLFITDVISFVSSGSSLFFPHVPNVHFLWFLPSQYQSLPLSLGQFLDICVILIIILQSSSTIYIILARFYRYQPASAGMPADVKRKLGDALPNFMRWNILPHGHLIMGHGPEDGGIDRNYIVNYRDVQSTSFESQKFLSANSVYRFNHPWSIPDPISNSLLISGYIRGSMHQHLLDCNILASRSERFKPSLYGSRAHSSPLILVSSCKSPHCNSQQKLEVFV